MLDLLPGISLVLWNRLLLQLGLRKPVDGWRRAVGLVLKEDAAKFVLSAFSLDVFSDEPSKANPSNDEIQQHISERLARFLASESAFSVLIRHEADEHVAAPHPGPSYTLGFQPPVDGPARFIRPDLWAGSVGTPAAPATSPLFEFICRITDRYADLWVRVNHVGADGVPVQEMLSRLEAAWGVGSPLVLPSIAEFESHTGPRFSPGRAETVEVQAFIEFGRLLDWRKQQNAKLPEPMTFAAAMMWWLAKHDVFSQVYFGTTVELPECAGIGRGVGVVVVRPADYFQRADGLAFYVKAFNRELELTRLRKSNGCRTLEAAAFIPARLEKKLLRHGLVQGTTAFGSVGLTILKDAKVFGAPLADAGHANGFIAVGSVGLQTSDGKRVGCVVVKGPKQSISSYARVLSEAMGRIT